MIPGSFWGLGNAQLLRIPQERIALFTLCARAFDFLKALIL
jgi:hypothetical protein